MSLHSLVPLAALLLNVLLGVLALARNPSSRLNRAFAQFVSAIALWNLGVFMLRKTPTEAGAYSWEIVIHVGLAALPAVYYHFLLVFLDDVHRRRRSLGLVCAVSAVFSAVNLTPFSPLLVAGVVPTVWGWAPTAGPLYLPFVLFLNAALLGGVARLIAEHRRAASSFSRSRISLILLGTALSLTGGWIDFGRFVLPNADLLYPVGIPANMLFALMLGTAIVRYRMFNVSVVVKQTFVYVIAWAVITAILATVTRALTRWSSLGDLGSIWSAALLGFAITLLLTPLGHRIEASIQHLTFSRRRGCYETVVELSKRMSWILSSEQLAETLVPGLVRGIPLSHCTLMARDESSRAFVLRREETTTGERTGVSTLDVDSHLIRWLQRKGGILVKEEARVNPELAQHFAQVPGELESVNAALIVPLQVESKLIGVLFVGEKLSGEIFNADELEVLSVLAAQAAVSMENAQLYEQAERERRRLEVLYHLSGRLAAVHETEQILSLVVGEATRLLNAEMAALRLVEDDGLVLRAWTDSSTASALRPRLHLGESLSGAVVATNQPVVVEDVLDDSRYIPDHRRAAESLDLHGFLGVPLRSSGRPIGVLYVYTKRRRRFLAEEISLLCAFADQAALTLEKDRLSRDRQQAEEALRQSEKLATMGQLLAGVAHELNNPLTVIVGYATLLRSQLDRSPLANAATEIDTAAGRCTRIVRNFLALARKHPPERQRVALNQIVTESIELVAYPLRVDGIETVTDLAAELPELWADPHQLQEVIVNLMTNAHHAMRDVSPPRRLTISTRFDRSRVVLSVADTGRGVPSDLRDRIFEPFFTTKPVGQGTGLGLSICHGIIESHGGAIRLENAQGRGAIFKIELPVEGLRDSGDEETVVHSEPAIEPKTVLVVDDEPAVARLLAAVLSVDHHRVEIASDGLAALDRLGEDHYDVVITDIRMPNLDGPALYQEARRRYPTEHPPFIFITGDMLSPDTAEFLEQMHAPCLSKPFAVEEVRRAIEEAMATVSASR